MISVSIVIFNLDRSKTKIILNALNKHTKVKKIHIVYNGQSSFDYNKLHSYKKLFNKLQCHKIKNNGFGNGHNHIIKNYNLQKYHLIINPDINITTENISKLYTFLVNNNQIAALGPKIYDSKNNFYSSVKLLPNPLIHVIRRINSKSKLNKKYELANYKIEQPTAVPTISGCFMMVNSQFLKKINGFDENFFLYFEDIDLLRRLSEYGDIFYFPLTHITHSHNQQSLRSIKFLIYHIKSLIIYYSKWGWIFDKLKYEINLRFLENNKKLKKYNL